MIWIKFSVVCKNCGYSNTPHPSPLIGVLMVFRGEWRTCRNCGVRFIKFIVPARPIVLQVLKEVEKPSWVVLREYSGKVPKALGVA